MGYGEVFQVDRTLSAKVGLDGFFAAGGTVAELELQVQDGAFRIPHR